LIRLIKPSKSLSYGKLFGHFQMHIHDLKI